jgi:hypothetical protein
MEQPEHLNRWIQRFRSTLVTGLVVALFIAGTVPPSRAQSNTALGTSALANDVAGVGIENTGLGFAALFLNETGSKNTAVGAGALQSNSVDNNTGVGYEALLDNTTGLLNTAVGAGALLSNTTGHYNTATGGEALTTNTNGSLNVADGLDALTSNTTGSENIATGYQAMYSNATGSNNIAVGFSALQGNSTGSDNVAIGSLAGAFTTGNNNIAIGSGAGGNHDFTGNNNIDIGNAGGAVDSNTIRIGTKGTQTRAFIAGIATSPIYGFPVVVNGNGRLGIQASSARYKRDIHNMSGASGKLMKLRPVTFRYKEDPSGTLQYGLVAEEVARVYPELVTYGDDGKPISVANHLLPAMLLNELQKQVRENQRKDAQIDALQKQVESLQKETARIDRLAARVAVLEKQARRTEPERLTAAIR